MASRLRAWVERLLPWYDPLVERARNRRTEEIRVHAIRKRVEAEQTLADYERIERKP